MPLQFEFGLSFGCDQPKFKVRPRSGCPGAKGRLSTSASRAAVVSEPGGGATGSSLNLRLDWVATAPRSDTAMRAARLPHHQPGKLRRLARATKAIPKTIKTGASQGILRSATLCRLRIATAGAAIRSAIPTKRVIERFMSHLHVRTLERATYF